MQQPGMTRRVVNELTDERAIRKARGFPYQLLTSFRATKGIPQPVRDALERAMEIALANVPRLLGRVVFYPDVSGSMISPIRRRVPVISMTTWKR